MRFSICIGTHLLLPFVRLNVAYLRRVFGDAPILVWDSPTAKSKEIEQVADAYGCAYHCERTEKSHFAGCMQASVSAVAFARANGSDIALKINQRFILLDTCIPQRVRDVFTNPQIDLAMPGQCRPESIVNAKSKFHANFKVLPDCVFMRASAFDPEWMARDYAQQWKTDTVNRYATFTEHWWTRQVEGAYKERHVKLPWLTENERGKPKLYLRKSQSMEMEYNQAAMAIGLPAGGMPVAEWSKLKEGSYRPAPMA